LFNRLGRRRERGREERDRNGAMEEVRVGKVPRRREDRTDRARQTDRQGRMDT